MTRADRATTLFRKASQDELVLEKLLADSDVRNLPIVARLRGVLLGHFAPVEVLRIFQVSLDELTRLRRADGMNAANAESHPLSSRTMKLTDPATFPGATQSGQPSRGGWRRIGLLRRRKGRAARSTDIAANSSVLTS